MTYEEAGQALKDFYVRFGEFELYSTSAKVVDYTGDLYNVEGSSPDPKIDGEAWKQLLISNGIDEDCYVTDPLPTLHSTHPGFEVGGHMTPNADGSVRIGGSCYLMPLCKWHNSTSKNRIPFKHTSTRMLKLSGYMKGELAFTFAARLQGAAVLRRVGVEGDSLTTQAIAEPSPIGPRPLGTDVGIEAAKPPYYLTFRKIEEDGAVRYVIEDARLP